LAVSDGSTGSGRAGGLSGALAQLGISALDLLRTRAELASVEFSEAQERTKEQVVVFAIAVAALAFASLPASALVVVYFWASYRYEALIGVTLAYFAIAAIALWRLKALQRNAPRPFAATLAEFERDRQWLAGQMGDRAEK
jgi:uncharacterized membrane protein YqjE